MHITSTLIQRVAPELLAWLDADPRPSLVIDADSTIHFMSEAYVAAARSGPTGDTFLSRWGLGARLLDACHGRVRSFLSNALAIVLQDGKPWRHRYPCHTPDRMQHFLLHVQPLGESRMLLLTHSQYERVDAEGERQLIEPNLEDFHFDPDGRVTRCYSCQLVRRTDDPSVWEPVAEALRGLPATRVSIGLCPPCMVAYRVRSSEAPL